MTVKRINTRAGVRFLQKNKNGKTRFISRKKFNRLKKSRSKPRKRPSPKRRNPKRITRTRRAKTSKIARKRTRNMSKRSSKRATSNKDLGLGVTAVTVLDPLLDLAKAPLDARTGGQGDNILNGLRVVGGLAAAMLGKGSVKSAGATLAAFGGRSFSKMAVNAVAGAVESGTASGSTSDGMQVV